MLHQQDIVGLFLDRARNALAVLSAEDQGPQNEQIKRSLYQSNTIFLVSGKHSTRVCPGSGKLSTQKVQPAEPWRFRGKPLPRFDAPDACTPIRLPLPSSEMQGRFFRERLKREFDSRRRKNPRYSLRALASFLGTDHSTLSQILKGTRRIPVSRIRSWAGKLEVGEEETAVYIAAEHTPDARTAARQHQVRQWTAEAMSVVNEPAHWHIVRLSREAGFRPDCRWLAKEIGVSVDAVNMALSRLLRLRLLEVDKNGDWKDRTGLRDLTEKEFRKLALKQARKLGAN